ncbi:MAG: hypothetical protein MJZ98_00655 [Paludibacteraceae bacterium]|nr:hypothetical protein [Paludibacteraceae bacterium]
MKEKELDNNYMASVQGAMKPLSHDGAEVSGGLDSIIVSNVTQTLSGGVTIDATENPVFIPSGTPIVVVSGKPVPVTNASTLTSANTGAVVGVVVRSFEYGKTPSNVSVAKAAHINVDALCSALADVVDSFDKEAFKAAYINDDWHKNLCLTFEQNL